MSTPTIAASMLDRTAMRVRVEAALYEFLGDKAESAATAGLPAEVVDTVRSFLLAGGKRIRPLFCVLGWYAGGGGELPDSVVGVAAAVELFHAAVLIHDDIIDDSTTRRDRPTVHCAVAESARGEHPDAARFGAHAALLSGDFGLVWSQELLHTAGLSAAQTSAAAPILDAMRTEVNYGQYLDLLTAGRPTRELERALEIIRYKTAAYTVERPLQLGAALAGAGPEVHGRSRPMGVRSARRSSSRTTSSGSTETRHTPANPISRTSARASTPSCSRSPCARRPPNSAPGSTP